MQIIDQRADGSTIVKTNRGDILNLDPPQLIYNQRTNTWYRQSDLDEAQAEEDSYH